MEEICLDESCLKSKTIAKFSCSCNLNLRLCSKHMLKHKSALGVHNEIRISSVVKELQSKALIALEKLNENQDDLLNTGKLMTIEIITNIQDTMMLLESRRIEIMNLINSQQYGTEINSKIEEINKISFQPKGGLQESIQKYLKLYENHENSIFKEEIIAIHKGIETSNIIFKEINEIRLKENENFMRKFEDLEKKINEGISMIKNYIQKEVLIKYDVENNKIKRQI